MQANAPVGDQCLLPAPSVHRQAPDEGKAPTPQHLLLNILQDGAQGGQGEVILADLVNLCRCQAERGRPA